MGGIWLKIKIWMKVILFVLIALYALFFFLNNAGKSVPVWFFFYREYTIPLLLLVFLTFLIGVIGTLLVRTTLRTISQIREVRVGERAVRLEREVADMKAKAAMLQTRADATGASSTPPSNPS